jgi:fructosamine-3-kinase
LARIHQVPGKTPRFGSDIPGYQSGICIEPAWYDYWADCFTSLVKAFLKQDIAVNGKWPAYETAFEILISRTIRRLLCTLQENGHRIVPTLVHGNLSAKNLGIGISDGMPVLFSPCPIYAHHEYELGVSRLAIGGLDRTYEDQYLRTVLPSQPIDEVHDRITLYGVLFNLRHSIPHNGLFRERYVKSPMKLACHRKALTVQAGCIVT